jgi:hypothetical protein
MSFVDGDPLRAAALAELVTEAALAQARLADDADYLRTTASRPGKRGLQSRHFVLAAN